MSCIGQAVVSSDHKSPLPATPSSSSSSPLQSSNPVQVVVVSSSPSLRSSGSPSSDGCAPIPVVAAPQSLRTWRITREGLVQVDAGTMGAFLDRPKTAKTNTDGEGNGLRYALSSMQGWRVSMEDASIVQVSMGERDPYKEWSFFAVFDGHAGPTAAEDAAENLLSTLIQTKQFEKVTHSLETNNGQLTDGCLHLLEEGFKHGFLSLDEDIRKKLDQKRSGSTAICAILTPTHIILANLGDSRAVVSRAGESAFGTEDHKPYNEKERQRIEDAGGSVMIQRINGSLAVSRALGDFEYKNVPGLTANQQLVSPEPDVYTLVRRHDVDEFMVLACDGVYDVMGNDELANFVRGRLQVHTDLKLVCNETLDACLTKGSRDNMTMIIVCFPAAPKIDEDKVLEESIWRAEMRSAIGAVLEGIDKEDKDHVDVEWVMRMLLSAPGVPPPDNGPAYITRSLIYQEMAKRGLRED